MKLRTKILAAAVSLLLLFSQVFSVWSLLEARKQILENILYVEWNELRKDIEQFTSALTEYSYLDEDMLKRLARERFYGKFSGEAVLYYQGEELANSTPYHFTVENGTPVSEAYPKVFLEKLNGIYLLVLYEEGTGQGLSKNFRILHYRDISTVYQEGTALLLRGIAAAILLSLALLALLSLILRQILKPFYQLRDAANVIAGGRYSERVENPGRDEIGEVAVSFNRMAEHVEEHIHRLAEMNEKQRQLLGALSHELKTPLTGIQGYAELLQRVKLPPERQADALGYMEEECKRLTRLSVKMLQLTELSGEETIEKKWLSVSRLFAQAEEITRCRRKEKQLRLDVCCGEGLEAEGDEDLLLSLLTNLLDNACKASPPGGTIKLMGAKEGLFVTDNGRGIPREEIPRITEPFYMVDKSRARKEGGAGLGLALCSQIARLHGGRLEIVSEAGSGSRIGIRWGER